MTNGWQTKSVMSVLDEVQKAQQLGVRPTRSEIAGRLGLSSKSTVQKHLTALRDGGLLEILRAGHLKITPFGALRLRAFREKPEGVR